MIRVYALVEGQTEETFIRELLTPHYDTLGLYLVPIVATTSPGHRGGIVRYAQVRPQIQRLCKQDRNAFVTTMFDLYGLPNDFPGKNGPEWSRRQDGRNKAALVEQEMAGDIDRRNFIPYIQVHEFESLLFVEPSCFKDWADADVVAALSAVRTTTEPEAINDDPRTAPSKRIQACMPDYQKTFHGPLIALDIGLDAMRAECPHFSSWLQRLDELLD